MDPTKHNYYPKVMALYAQGKVPRGAVTEVNICHDDWCRVYRGGYCNCDPEIELLSSPEAKPVK